MSRYTRHAFRVNSCVDWWVNNICNIHHSGVNHMLILKVFIKRTFGFRNRLNCVPFTEKLNDIIGVLLTYIYFYLYHIILNLTWWFFYFRWVLRSGVEKYPQKIGNQFVLEWRGSKCTLLYNFEERLLFIIIGNNSVFVFSNPKIIQVLFRAFLVLFVDFIEDCVIYTI